MQHTLVAVFDNRSDAQNARDELLASGFTSTDVNVSSADPTGQTSSLSDTGERTEAPLLAYEGEPLSAAEEHQVRLYIDFLRTHAPHRADPTSVGSHPERKLS